MARNPIRFVILALLSCLVAACGSSSEDDHKDFFIDTKGRLAIGESGATGVRILDLDTGQTVGTFALDHPPSALYASPGGRYVLAVQRENDLVQTIDGGVWQEDHGDHLHDYKRPPAMAAFRIAGPRPTHYDDRHGRASIFMDGRAGPPQIPSYAVLLDDLSIARGQLLAQLPALPYAVHGFAEPNGDFLVVTHRSADAVDVLPNYLHVWRRSGEGFVKTQELSTRCDRMHGSYTRQNITVAGCAEGVALVRRDPAGQFTTQFVSASHRVGVVIGHPGMPRMIGAGNTGTPATTRFSDIDLDSGRASPITIDGWSEGRLRRAHGWNRQGTRFFVLDDQGTLYALEFNGGAWRTVGRQERVIAAMPTAAPFPTLVSNGAKDELYLSDPLGQAIVTIDSGTLAVRERTALGFTPSTIAWVGIAR